MAKESNELAKAEPAIRIPSGWDMDKWFEDFRRGPFPSVTPLLLMQEAMFNPVVDIFEEGNNVVVKAELPGMKKEEINITLKGGSITVAGEKRFEQSVETKAYYMHESSYGSFCRVMTLPSKIRKDKVTAEFKDGILEIRMPKTEEAKKKEIKVKIH